MRSWFFAALMVPLSASAFDGFCAHDSIRVAVIDTGADVDHPALQGALWTNPGETGIDAQGHDKSKNGIDDDANGFIDDVHGWDFLRDTGDVSDRSGHGTHIAGLIRANADRANNVRLASTTAGESRAQLMILKYFDPGVLPRRTIDPFRRALEYALKMNAQVIHISGGGYSRREAEYALLREAERKGVLVIAASGNKSVRQTDRPFYPAAYDLPNVFPVAALDPSGQVLKTTNLVPGRKTFFESGFGILSSLPHRRYGALTGTSQAAGIFTGKLLAKKGPCAGPLVASSSSP